MSGIGPAGQPQEQAHTNRQKTIQSNQPVSKGAVSPAKMSTGRNKVPPSDSNTPPLQLPSAQQIKNGEAHRVVISHQLLEKLFPAGFLKGKAEPDAWDSFDTTLLDRLLDLLDSNCVESVQTSDGEWHQKIAFASPFEEQLYSGDPAIMQRNRYQCRGTMELEKARIIHAAYEETLGQIGLSSEEQATMQHVILKYVDFLSANTRNARKILKKNKKIQEIALQHPELYKKGISPFLQKVSKDMTAYLKQIPRQTPRDHVAIAYSRSGGAHVTIKDVLERSLTSQEIPVRTIDESSIYTQDDALYRTTGLPYTEVYNKVMQRAGQHEYGEKLRRLNVHVGNFLPDQRMTRFREHVGNAGVLVSTSHYAHNVRLAGDEDRRVCFQVCDYGAFPEGLHELAKTVVKYDLQNILFHAPSTSTTLRTQGSPGGPLELRGKPRHEKQPLEKSYEELVRLNEYPVNEWFKEEISSEEIHAIREKYGLRQAPDPNMTFVLTMGAQGVGGVLEDYIDQIVKGLLEDPDRKPIDLCILCGGNTQMREALPKFLERRIAELTEQDPELRQELQQLIHCVALPRIPNVDIAKLGKACTVFLSKAGGGTASEALAAGIPMAVHKDPHHYWEFGNVDELEAAGCVVMDENASLYEVGMRMKTKFAPRPRDQQQAVEYTVSLLWKIDQARQKLRQQLF